MTRTAKHTEPTQNSHTAAYGYKYRYDGFGGSAQASHGLSPRHTVTELGSTIDFIEIFGIKYINCEHVHCFKTTKAIRIE
jgi:hypothetical protein